MSEGPKNIGEGGAGNGASEPNEWEMMAQEAAKEAAERTGADKISEDDLALQRKLLELSQRDDKFDSLSDDEMAKHETGVKDIDVVTHNWDDLGEDLDWFEQIAKNGDDRDKRMAAKYVQQVLDRMRAILDSIDGLGSNDSADAEMGDEDDEFHPPVVLNSAELVTSNEDDDFHPPMVQNSAESIFTQNSDAETEQAMTDRESWDARVADMKSKFERMTNFDELESEEDYERRMKTGVISQISIEMNEHPERNLTQVEYDELTGMYPQGENESDEDYAKRIKDETNIDIGRVTRGDMGLDGDDKPDFVTRVTGEVVDDEAEAAERHARAERARQALRTPLFANMCKKYKVSVEDLDSFSDDEVLMAMEAYRQQLEDWAKMSVEEGGAGYSDEELKKISDAGGVYLEDLMKRFDEYLGKGLGEDISDAKEGDASDVKELEDKSAEEAETLETERLRLIKSLDNAKIKDILKLKDIKIENIEEMSVEELNDLREQLRKYLIDAFDMPELKKVLVKEDLKIEDIEAMSLEELVDLREKFKKMVNVEGRNDPISKPEVPKEKEDEKTDEKDKKKSEPLIAVMVDRERDAKITARQMAEDLLEMRINAKGEKGFGHAVRNWFFGTMLKNYETRRYEHMALEAIKGRQNTLETDGLSLDMNNYWSYLGDGAGGLLVETMTTAYTQGMEDSLIHTAAGDEMATYGVEIDENGNQQVFKYSERGTKKEAVDANSAEAKSTIAVREAIASYATGKMSERDFREAVKRAKADMAKEGHDDTSMIDTLFETACAAKECVEHEASINDVMDGFRLINADYQIDVRTEEHRGKIDQLVDKWENSKLGTIVKPEIVAGALGIFAAVGTSGARKISNVVLPLFGGAAVGGVLAGLREHEHVAADRAEQARRIARGEEIGNTKYDRQMKETIYKSYKAEELTADLQAAIEKGDDVAIQRSLATIEALRQVSDSRHIDLISFSSGDKATMQSERFALEKLVGQAKADLKGRGVTDKSEAYVRATMGAYEVINEDITAKDAAFRKLRAKRVAAQAAKTAGIGVVAGLGAQEISAAFNPNSYGLFDKLNENLNIRFEPLNLGVNNLDAHKTLLAGWLGIDHSQVITTVEQIRAAEATGVELTEEEQAALEKDGYTLIKHESTTYEQNTRVENVSAKEYAHENGSSVSRAWGGNGTENIWDGNETGVHVSKEGGYIYTTMRGDSWNDTQTVNFDKAVQDGKVKLFLSLSKDTQGTPIEISGVVKDGQMIFKPDDPALQEIIANKQYAFAEVAYVSGDVTKSGAQKIFMFGTAVGSNDVVDGLQRTVTETVPITKTVYDVVGFERQAEKIMEGSDLVDGAIALPFAGRKNLTRGKKGKKRNEGPNNNPQVPSSGDDNPPNPPSGGNYEVPPRPPFNPTRGGDNPPNPPSGSHGGDNPPPPPSGPAAVVTHEVPPKPRWNAEAQTENKPDLPVRAAGDYSPISVTSNQIREIANRAYADAESADLTVALLENDIHFWNNLPPYKREHMIGGDFSDCTPEFAAEAQEVINDLSNYGLLSGVVSFAPKQEQKLEQKSSFESIDDYGEWGKVVTKVEFSDDEIDAMFDGKDESFKRELKEAIRTWNSASDEERKKYMTGDGATGTKMSEASIMLMNLGNSFVGPVEDVEATKARAREALGVVARNRYEPITDASDTRNIEVSDKRIRELNPNGAPDEKQIQTIRLLLKAWNNANTDQRKKMLAGDFSWASKTGTYLANNFSILKQFNIINIPESGELSQVA